MGLCKLCKKSGLFLGVNNLGLCPQCAKQFELDKKQRIRIISESMQIIQDSKKLDTQLSRLGVLLEHATAMQVYENVGIQITDPPLSKLISDIPKVHDQLIMDSIQDEYENMKLSLNTPSITSKMKITKISKVITKAKEYQPKLNNPMVIGPFISDLEITAHQMQLNTYIETAEKAEFKGSKKKAIDQYLEALYFLKTDDIDDELQKDQIEGIETKISELKGD